MSTIYKRFRDVLKTNKDNDLARIPMSPRFDQPSYLSFKVLFGEGDVYYNNAASEDYVLNYDIMPQPLFQSKGNPDVYDRKKYSSIDYLLDANEFTRASMLENFINLWFKLQYNYQWYFQKIEGVSDLLKIDPKKGMRVTSDKRISITALEAVDLRLTHLLNMYRKIAWDDTYQRWVLPDMMRYFTMDIYIMEFRTFHTPEPFDGYGAPTANVESSRTLKLNILDDILPVWKIRCEMCEFDLENIELDYLSSLGVNETPTEAGVKFSIKVGKMYEEQVYPTFQNAYLIDRAINGLDRSKYEDFQTYNNRRYIGNDINGNPIYQDDGQTSQLAPFDSTSSNANSNSSKYNNKLLITKAQDQTYNNEDMTHISGTSYNEQTNKNSIEDRISYDNLPLSKATDQEAAENDAKKTWFTNAADLGKSFLENKFEQILDKGKITPIPGLGISFSEAKAALQGKNIITALGLIRRGINNVVSEFAQPSELLEGNIYVDTVFKEYLQNVAKSEATNEAEVALIAAANTALNDDGTWSQIKDFSLATDLVGPGEENDPNPIEGGQLYEKSQSTATNTEINQEQIYSNNVTNTGDSTISRGQIFEGVPSSQATTSKIQTG